MNGGNAPARAGQPDLPSQIRDSLSGKKVLVTGATGFIGSHLIEKLVCVEAAVTAVAPDLGWRPIVRHLTNQGRVHFVQLQEFWNRAALERVAPALRGVEFVVHLAYAVPHGRDHHEKAAAEMERNVLGTVRLVQSLPDSVSKICFASSALVYGLDSPRPVSESDCTYPATAYAAGKLATECYLRQHAQETDTSVVALRYATVYGPMEMVPRAIPNFIRCVLAGKPPVINGTGNDLRDYVNVSDVVKATLLALSQQTSLNEVYNVGTGEGHSTREIAERIIRLSGARVKPIFKPTKCMSRGVVCSISRARTRLGFEPSVALDQGLKDEINWFAANQGLWRAS